MSLADRLKNVCVEFKKNEEKVLRKQAKDVFNLIVKRLEEVAYNEGEDTIEFKIDKGIQVYLAELLKEEGYSIREIKTCVTDCNIKRIEIIPTYKLESIRREFIDNCSTHTIIEIDDRPVRRNYRPKPQTGTMKIR